MKYILFCCLLGAPSVVEAQFVVGNSSMTVLSGTILSVDNMVLNPTTAFTIQNNELQRINTVVPIGSGNSIERIYLFRNALNYSGYLGFYYQDNELAGNTESGLSLLYSENANSNNWINGGGTVNTVNNYISTTFLSVPVMRVTASGTSPLPVTLLDFTAHKDAAEEAAILEWKVTKEQNFKEYVVERSGDNGLFLNIGTVPATGSKGYHLVDKDPFEGKNFYRLKMVDINGSYSYSHVVVLTFDKVTSGVHIYPNPVTEGHLTITMKEKPRKDIVVTIMDMSGRIRHIRKLDNNTMDVDVTSWPSGSYLIRMGDSNVFKFVKQ